MNRTTPSVGSVENGYRFKGGDPAQESSWEQVGPVDVSTEWGSGARQLPNGTIERVGPRGGVTKLSAAATNGGGGGEALVGADARARFMLGLGPLKASQANLAELERDGNPLNQNWGAALLDQATEVPFLRNIGDSAARTWGGDDYGRYTQAAASYESALLPIMSGAAVTPSEAQRIIRADLPQLGDSPEVLRRKAENRAMRINGVAKGIGEEAPFLPAVEDGDNGLPSYPGIKRMTAGITESPLPGGGYGGGGSTPGGSPDTAIDYTSTPPDQLVQLLANGGWVRQGNGEPYQVPAGSVRRDAQQEGDQQVANGVVQRPQSVRQIVDERDGMNGFLRRIDAGVRGAADTMTFGFADELAAGANTVLPLDRGSRSLWQDGLGDAWKHNIAMQRGIDQSDAREVPVSRGAGQLAGVLAAPGALQAARWTAQAGNGAGLLARGAVTGGAFGGAYGAGAGQGNPIERLPEAGSGAAWGAAAGGVATPLAGPLAQFIARPVQRAGLFGGRVAGRAMQAAGFDGPGRALEAAATPNALNSGLDSLMMRTRPQGLSERAAEFRSVGIDPTLADVVDDGSRGLMRAMATRQTPGRTAAREFADSRAAGLQDRLSVQARRNLSDDARSPLQMREEITARRSAQADQSFGAVRNEPIHPERSVIEALRAPATRTAIEEAATAALNRGDGDTANLLRQLVDGALDDPSGVNMTVGIADRISRSLNGRAEGFQRSGNNDAASSFFSLAERLRGSARQQVPGYDEALRAYSADSGLAQATEIGEQFLSMEADDFAAAVARLNPEERAIAQAAARRAVERAAGTQGAAPGVAQRLSNGREQGIRTAALAPDPQAFQNAVGLERQALMNARGVNPMQGSPTAANSQDAANLSGAVDVAMDIGTANAPSLMRRMVAQVQSMGFDDREAEAVITAAIDPAQTDALIEYLSRAMPRPEAARMVAYVRSQVGTNAGVNSQGR
jgi:hypothetical protein